MEQYITVGKILKTQGRKGELRVLPLTDFPERFSAGSEVLAELQGQRKTLRIERAYPHKKFIIIKFAGIDDIDAGEKLKSSLLVIPPGELTPLPEDSFYIFDIVGLEVYDYDESYLGKVKEVLQTGANDVFIVEKDQERPLLIPALKKVILSVDEERGRMTVSLPKGLKEV